MVPGNFGHKTLIQRFLWTLQATRDYAGRHPVREIERLALEESVQYIRGHMPAAMGYHTTRRVLEHALAVCEVEGHFLEFGVYKGGSIRFLAKQIAPKTIHGFDSFEGLPEDWAGFALGKNAFGLRGKLPRVPRNALLHAGWFDQTLPKWLERNEGPVAFIYFDCDLYSSTKTALDLLAPRVRPGTVMVFDEYFNYPNWQEHEFKAFQEFVAQNKVEYAYLAYARIQVAVKILSIGAPKSR
ncbi:MAG: TylF/MycF/NovP-related O-methyltransferase [bacterium]